MKMDFADLYSGSALAGSGSGAMTGLSVGGPWGALAGGVIGGLGGAYANSKRDEGTAAQGKNLTTIANNLRAMSQRNYDNYLQQLNKTLGYYGPVMDTWDSLYGKAGDQTMRSKMGVK